MKRQLVSCLRVSLFLGLLLLPKQALAHDEDFQSWTLLTLTAPTGLDPKLRFYTEAQPRVGDNAQHIERLLLRTALYYKLDDHWTGWLGYGWTPTFLTPKYTQKFNQEHRIWTQLQREAKDDISTDVLRLRLEQRFIGQVGEVANRLRTMYRMSSTQGLIADQRFTAYDELFINLNDTSIPKAGYDRNRIFVGPYWTDGPARFEFGYLNELSKRQGTSNRDVHAVLLSIGLTL